MFPPVWLVTITLVDQAAINAGTENAPPRLRLHMGNGERIKSGRRVAQSRGWP